MSGRVVYTHDAGQLLNPMRQVGDTATRPVDALVSTGAARICCTDRSTCHLVVQQSLVKIEVDAMVDG